MTDTNYNRLKNQKSAYLKQHENNPIHWWPYSPEALLKAKEENKPIFLSVGYSSCHWCHVMAKEAFSHEEVAEFINENYIAIKVDKEEHPDIDNYYQQACQLFTRQGGWPLSAFLLPDMKPYYAGTYFPVSDQGDKVGFLTLIKELKAAFDEDIEKVQENADKVAKSISEGLMEPEKVEFEGHFPAPNGVLHAIKEFEDSKHGGYAAAPKFPQFAFYEWAVEQMLEGMVDKERSDHIIKSIENMLLGGLNDHARGGIHRYSVDEKWKVPHFEKMLYDQAGLLKLLSKFSLIHSSPLVFDTLLNTLHYLETEMLSEKGFFFSAQDADSEGVEGLYFCYTMEEFEDIINEAAENVGTDFEDNKEQIKKWFDITADGNFTQQLNVISLNPELASEYVTKEGWDIVREIRKAILEDRKNRIPPTTDSKGVASWNFQLLSGLIDVIQYCRIPIIKSQASAILNKSLEGIFSTFIKGSNQENISGKMEIIHSSTLESSNILLEDYVFFSDLQLRMYEVTGNTTFKDNLSATLKFIEKEFLNEGKIYTRSVIDSDTHLYPNIEPTHFDQSFRSSISTLIGVLKRAKLLLKDDEIMESYKTLQENLVHQILKSPLNGGEGLRALSYPDLAYKLVKAPKTWLNDSKFVDFLAYFMPRFVFEYYDVDEKSEESQRWEICSNEACELTGIGIDEFINTLRPKAPEDSKNEETKEK